jgi:hypothetical protein
VWNEAILEKFPEEENEEPFHASPAETENTGKTEVHGGTVETSHGCSAQSDWARKNTHHTDAGIGSSRPERVHSSQAVDAKERVLSRVSLQFSAAAFSKMSPD